MEEVVQQNMHPESDFRIRILVQPDAVQVKRVGRASCIEPELKVCLDSEATYPQSITLNAYLKVLGKDNKHKLILLRKSDELMMTKTHHRELVSMKLRFLKTIKVQVLKRNLGVARPEASVIFEAVNRHGEVLATTSTNHFAIISDPRYLDDVKKRLVDRPDVPESDDDPYQPPRTIKRRRVSPAVAEYEGPLNTADSHLSFPLLANGNVDTYDQPSSSSPSSPFSSPSSPSSPSCLASPTPIYLTPLQKIRNISDFELFADSEEEYKLIKLVEGLKYRGCQQLCSFQIMPSTAQM